MRIRLLLAAAAPALLLTSCGLAVDAPNGATSQASTPWWLLPFVLSSFLILLLALVWRGSKRSPALTSSSHIWREDARKGYTEARWLYDALSEDLATWRGNAMFEGTSEGGAKAASALADTWRRIDTRLGRASDSLYSLEVTAPDRATVEAANATVAAMREVRRAVDARAESRTHYRTVEAESSIGETVLIDAREREVRASRMLAEARSDLGRAIANLSQGNS